MGRPTGPTGLTRAFVSWAGSGWPFLDPGWPIGRLATILSLTLVLLVLRRPRWTSSHKFSLQIILGSYGERRLTGIKCFDEKCPQDALHPALATCSIVRYCTQYDTVQYRHCSQYSYHALAYKYILINTTQPRIYKHFNNAYLFLPSYERQGYGSWIMIFK